MPNDLLYPQAPEPVEGPLLVMLKDFVGKTADSYSKALKEHRYHMRQMLAKDTPNVVPVQAAGVTINGDLVLDLGGPQLGRKWDIRLLRVSNSTHVNTAVGTGDIANFYIGSPRAYSPVNWAWQFVQASSGGTIPGTKNFTSNSLSVTPSDHLFCVYTSTTAANPILASALILDYSTVSNAGSGFEVI